MPLYMPPHTTKCPHASYVCVLRLLCVLMPVYMCICVLCICVLMLQVDSEDSAANYHPLCVCPHTTMCADACVYVYMCADAAG